jgi:methyl-accepting chemotaxis protein
MAIKKPTFMIKHKLWFGFGILLTILGLIAATAVLSGTTVQREVRGIIEQDQPAVLVATELASALERASASLGYLLLSGEDLYKQAYEQELAKLTDIVARLQQNPLVQADSELNAIATEVATDLASFEGYKAQMLSLIGNQAGNFPGTAYAAQNLNPISQQMLNQLTQFLLTESDEEVTAERKQLAMEVGDLRYKWSNVMNGVRAYLAYRAPAALAEVELYQGEVERLTALIRDERSDLLTLDQEESILQFADMSGQFFANLEKLKAIHGSDEWRTDAYLVRTELGPLLNRIQSNLKTLVDKLTANINGTTADLLDSVTLAKTLVLVFSVIGLLAGVAGAVIMAIVISRPLTHVVQAMRDIAHGEGDLTQRLQVRGKDEVGQLSDAFNSFIGQIHDVIADVKRAFAQLSAAAERMSEVTIETGQSVTEQRTATDQVATAVNELNATAQQMADTSANTAESAKEANDQTQSGKRVVSQTIEAINSLSAEVDQAAEVIRKVETDSESIGTVLHVIRGIAEQTNLLALNAAIEAARAGEQGRGFAVVADEVRTLASRTQDSTQEIQAMIERLQAATGEAVSVMEASRNRAKAGVEQAAEAGTALGRITDAVDSITAMNTQIARAADEQSSVVEEITRNVINISEVSDLTSRRSEELATSSHQVTELSAQLRALVSRFQVNSAD